MPYRLHTSESFYEIAAILRREVEPQNKRDQRWFIRMLPAVRNEIEELLAWIYEQPALEKPLGGWKAIDPFLVQSYEKDFAEFASRKPIPNLRSRKKGGRPSAKGRLGTHVSLELARIFAMVSQPAGGTPSIPYANRSLFTQFAIEVLRPLPPRYEHIAHNIEPRWHRAREIHVLKQ